MSDQAEPLVYYEAYNPATDEAPVGGEFTCDGVTPDDEGQNGDGQ